MLPIVCGFYCILILGSRRPCKGLDGSVVIGYQEDGRGAFLGVVEASWMILWANERSRSFDRLRFFMLVSFS